MSAGSDPKDADRLGGRQPEPQSFWFSPTGLVTLGFLGVASYYLVTEHAAHLFGVLPLLLIAACPLMHLLMHRGHHGGHDHGTTGEPEGKR